MLWGRFKLFILRVLQKGKHPGFDAMCKGPLFNMEFRGDVGLVGMKGHSCWMSTYYGMLC